jgi:hypothetical protein
MSVKTFYARLQPAKEEQNLLPKPRVRTIKKNELMETFLRIKAEVRNLVETRLAMLARNPAHKHLILKKGEQTGRSRRQNNQGKSS